jgi:hypothetical protein
MDAAAAASAPVSFTDDHGRQFVVPVSSLFFSEGAIQTNDAELKDNPAFATWIQYLAKNGQLRETTQAAAQPAMELESLLPGTIGNATTVTIADAGTGAADTFTATVTESEEHAELTPAGVAALASELVSLDPASPSPPLTPKTGSYANSATGTTITVLAEDGVATAFVLNAKTAAATTTVTIGEVDPDDDSFSMTIVREKTKSGVKAADMATEFGYALVVSGAALLPAAGTFQLSGGEEPQDAVPAKVTLMTT